MEIVSIDVQLTVEEKSNNLVAHLVLSNNTGDQLYLDKHTICHDGKFRNEVFEIVDNKGRKVRYAGPFVRRKIKSEDFILMEVDEKMESTVLLNDAYYFTRGKKYTIQFSAFNPGLLDDSPLMEMQSNKVDILYK